MAIYVTPDYYNRERASNVTASTPARNSKRKNSGRSSKNSSNNSESSNSSKNSGRNNSQSSSSSSSSSSGSNRKPKFNARNAIKRIVRDHLFGAFTSSHHRRSKRFLTSIYPSQRTTGYYRTRPIHQVESSFDLPQSSYRTVPLRSNGGHLNSHYLNNRMNAFLSAPIISPLRSISSPAASPIVSPIASSPGSPVRSSMNSPIVNVNPSINHPKSPNNYAFTTENSNAARNKPAAAEHSSTTDNSLAPDDESSDETLKQECAGSILTDR